MNLNVSVKCKFRPKELAVKVAPPILIISISNASTKRLYDINSYVTFAGESYHLVGIVLYKSGHFVGIVHTYEHYVYDGIDVHMKRPIDRDFSSISHCEPTAALYALSDLITSQT